MELPEKGSIDNFYIATKERAEEQTVTAKELIEQIETHYKGDTMTKDTNKKEKKIHLRGIS